MKRVCFIRIIKKQSITHIDWQFQNVKPFELIAELPTSFCEGNYPIEIIDYNDLDSNTSLVVSLTSTDVNDAFHLDALKKVFNTNCKNIFIDLSTHDHQEIPIQIYEFCRMECNKELYFLDKNLIDVADDIIYYEQHMWHAINSVVPNRVLNNFKQLNDWEKPHIRSKKGLFLSGHIRFHKLELLNHFYEKGLLDENFIWSSTDETWEPESFRQFIPFDKEAEYRKFKILERIPHMPDFDFNQIKKQGGYSPNANIVHYLSTYFEIILETQFYHKDTNDYCSTRSDWNNISEKTFKAIRLGNPFIMVSKPNTLKLLKDKFGFDFEMKGWMHEYDSIQNDTTRMESIKNKIESVLQYDNLHDLYYEYFTHKFNNDIFIENFYNQTLNIIFNKF